MNISAFPDDILNEIILRLSVDDIIKFAENNDYFRDRYCSNVDKIIWKLLYERDISGIQRPEENYAFHYLSIISELKELPSKPWRFYAKKQPTIPYRNPRKLPKLKNFADTNFTYDRYKEKAMIYFQYGVVRGYEQIVARVFQSITFDEDIMEAALAEAIDAGQFHIIILLQNCWSPFSIIINLENCSLPYVNVKIPIFLINLVSDEVREYPDILHDLLYAAIEHSNFRLIEFLVTQPQVKPILKELYTDTLRMYVSDIDRKLLKILRPHVNLS